MLPSPGSDAVYTARGSRFHQTHRFLLNFLDKVQHPRYDTAMTTATQAQQPYRVGPFSGGDAGREAYRLNYDRVGGDATPCVICGRAIKDGSKTVFVGTMEDGTWATDGTDGTMGAFPIGSDCHRKYRVRA